MRKCLIFLNFDKMCQSLYLNALHILIRRAINSVLAWYSGKFSYILKKVHCTVNCKGEKMNVSFLIHRISQVYAVLFGFCREYGKYSADQSKCYTHFIWSLKTITITIFAEKSFKKECYWDKKQAT